MESCQSCIRERSFRSLVAVWWSAKQRRGYRRALSGLTIGRGVGADLRFLTLTSSPRSPRVVQKSLQILVKRISRMFGKFEYCCVRTLRDMVSFTRCIVGASFQSLGFAMLGIRFIVRLRSGLLVLMIGRAVLAVSRVTWLLST